MPASNKLAPLRRNATAALNIENGKVAPPGGPECDNAIQRPRDTGYWQGVGRRDKYGPTRNFSELANQESHKPKLFRFVRINIQQFFFLSNA